MTERTIEDFRRIAHTGAEVYDLTPDGVGAVMGAVQARGNKHILLLSMDGYQKMIADQRFADYFDQNTVFASLRERGYAGKVLGIDVYTDAFLEQSQRFVTASARILTLLEV